jgi:hypothetical protein
MLLFETIIACVSEWVWDSWVRPPNPATDDTTFNNGEVEEDNTFRNHRKWREQMVLRVATHVKCGVVLGNQLSPHLPQLPGGYIKLDHSMSQTVN